MNELNTRILLVDDEEAIHKNVSLVLAPPKTDNQGLSDAASALFGDEPKVEASSDFSFDVSCAHTGQQALEMATEAKDAGRPFAAVFCDMRMPGWDGLKTVEELRRLDERIEVVFLTAFSDHSIEEIARSVGVNIAYMTKPFSRPDLKQMAIRCVVDWNKARELELFVETISRFRGEEADLETVLGYIVGELCTLLQSDSVAVAELDEGTLVLRAGRGELAQQEVFDKFSANIPLHVESGRVVTVGDLHVVPILSYGLALTVASAQEPAPDKLYLVKVFLEHASIALENCRLQSALLERQRMADIGQAVGFVSHDLRGPIGLAEMILSRLVSGKKMRWTVEETYRKLAFAMSQARQLTDDILLYARANMTIEPQPSSLPHLIADNEDYWSQLAENHRVNLVIDDIPAGMVTLDGPRLFRGVTNVVKNAIEAAAGAGLPDGEAEVRVCARQDEAGLTLSVSDSGGGMPAEVMDHLFTPFASFGKAGGTGFGLAIANEVVSLHEGDIDVVALPAGTRIDIRIPQH